MILSKPDLLRYIATRKIRFDPAVPTENVEQVSIDLRLGHRFTTLKKVPEFIPTVCVDTSIWEADFWDEQEADSFILQPRQLVLAQTLEKVTIPADLVGLVEGRSSFARLGITIHVTAPKIDPGFNTHITLEMYNFNTIPITLRAEKDKPAQLMFLKLSKKLKDSELYGAKASHIFQGTTSPIPKKKK